MAFGRHDVVAVGQARGNGDRHRQRPKAFGNGR